MRINITKFIKRIFGSKEIPLNDLKEEVDHREILLMMIEGISFGPDEMEKFHLWRSEREQIIESFEISTNELEERLNEIRQAEFDEYQDRIKKKEADEYNELELKFCAQCKKRHENKQDCSLCVI